jgi:hypothetical protein
MRLGPMRLRQLALLLVLYVSAEFSNPLMPGAVTFDGGSMETAKTQRHRPDPPGALHATYEMPALSAVPEQPAVPIRVVAAPRRDVRIVRQMVSPRDPASPTDDH